MTLGFSIGNRNSPKTDYLLNTFFTPSIYAYISSRYDFDRTNLLLKNVVKQVARSKRTSLSETLQSGEKNVRLISFLRKYYLSKMADANSVSFNAFDSILMNEAKLPTKKQLLTCFPDMKAWGKSSINNNNKEMLNNRRHALLHDADVHLESYSLEETLECLGCSVYLSSPFNFYCESRNIYEMLTQEYVATLANYLMGDDKESVNTIVEIGAGSGRLSFFLQRELDQHKRRPMRVIATDSFDWKIKNKFNVHKIKNEDAIAKFMPDVVVKTKQKTGTKRIDFLFYFLPTRFAVGCRTMLILRRAGESSRE